MATPITPTPILEGKDAIAFNLKVEEGLKRPLKLEWHPPRIKDIMKVLRKDAAIKKRP